MQIRKVHMELNDVNRETSYDLGYFSISFEDGEVTFRLYATLCATPGCPCDNLKCDWFAGDQPKTTWYTGDGSWLDENRKPLPKEVAQVFRIAEQTPEFQERYLHLVYLRRRMVLRELAFDASQAPVVPAEVLLPNAMPESGCLGVIHSGGHNWRVQTSFCGDPECFCFDVFLNLDSESAARDVCVRVDLANQRQWVEPPVGEADAGEKAMVDALFAEARLQPLLDFMRRRRRLENYARFVGRYEDQHLLLF